MRTVPKYRYEEVAGFVASLVERGTLSPGSKVPSLRQISRQRKVSLTTALQAYRALEDRGIVEARPQSGFFVARGSAISLEPPGMSQPPGKAAHVAVSDLVVRLLEHAANPKLVPFGCAIPSTDLLAAGRLDRFLARAARVKGVELQHLHDAQGRPAAAPGDRAARIALGTGPVSRGHRDHLRLYRSGDARLAGGVAARRYHRHRIADLFRAAVYAGGAGTEGA